MPLKPNAFYHIYLSGEYEQRLFRSSADYEQFLRLYTQHMSNVFDTYAYCLLPNHFHFFVRVHTLRGQINCWEGALEDFRPSSPFTQLKRLLNDDTAPLNGNLPLDALQIIQVTQRQQFPYLIRYIHQNPTLHAHCDNFRNWRWSSYRALLGGQPTRIPTEIVMRWFHTVDWFEELHWETQDITQLGYLIVAD
ncbi:MAG: hypothetical protein ACPG8W_19095 [Candidatus Promineifilaceae bacterium]